MTLGTASWLRLQFSMRWLFGLVLGCAVIAALLRKRDWASEQAIEVLRARDVILTAEPPYAPSDILYRQKQPMEKRKRILIRYVCLDGMAVDTELLKAIRQLGGAADMSCCEAKFEAGAWAALSGMPRLQELVLTAVHVDQDACTAISQNPDLRQLDLDRTGIDDQGLQIVVATCTSLESLSLSGTRATDDGLRHLAGLQRLNALELRDARITDNGLRHLASLKRLGYLGLRRTLVSSNGVEQLLRAIPEFKFVDLRNTVVGEQDGKRLFEAFGRRVGIMVGNGEPTPRWPKGGFSFPPPELTITSPP